MHPAVFKHLKNAALQKKKISTSKINGKFKIIQEKYTSTFV